jgi:antitoxin HicB
MTLNDYLKLEYPITLIPTREEGYVASLRDLPGCVTQGETAQEALEMLEEAKHLWLETALEIGKTISMPNSSRTDQDFSGRFVTRVPRSLHRDLVEAAKHEGVSLNQWVLTLLSSGNAKHGSV